MISNETIRLVKPAANLVDDFQLALIESYEDLNKYLAWAEKKPDIETTRQNMLRARDNFENKEEELRFIVQRIHDNKIVGCAGLLIRNMNIPYLEIGYWVRSSEAKKGYIGMAVHLLEEYAVKELKVKRLEIKMAESNKASIQVAERAGFKYEATIHSDRKLPIGKVDNTCVYYKLYS